MQAGILVAKGPLVPLLVLMVPLLVPVMAVVTPQAILPSRYSSRVRNGGEKLDQQVFIDKHNIPLTTICRGLHFTKMVFHVDIPSLYPSHQSAHVT